MNSAQEAVTSGNNKVSANTTSAQTEDCIQVEHNKTVLHTTFNLLREHQACEEGYRKLAKHLGGVTAYGRDTPINLLVILESNGVDDMLWSLRATQEDAETVSRRLAIQFAEQALPIFEKHVPGDMRPRDAITAAKNFLEGKIKLEALLKARDAAWDAARDAAWDAARDAAWDAARAAARDAARAAARDAAWAAARAAAWDAARAAARDAQAQMILAELAFDAVMA
jgi:hypothetical protein